MSFMRNAHEAGWLITRNGETLAQLTFLGWDFPFIVFSLEVLDETAKREEFLTFEGVRGSGIVLVNRADSNTMLGSKFLINSYDTADVLTCDKIAIRDFNPYYD